MTKGRSSLEAYGRAHLKGASLSGVWHTNFSPPSQVCFPHGLPQTRAAHKESRRPQRKNSKQRKKSTARSNKNPLTFDPDPSRIQHRLLSSAFAELFAVRCRLVNCRGCRRVRRKRGQKKRKGLRGGKRILVVSLPITQMCGMWCRTNKRTYTEMGNVSCCWVKNWL